LEKHGKAETSEYYDREWKRHWRKRHSPGPRLGWERREALAHRAASCLAGSVLDLGCGFGILAKFIKAPYLGIDFSKHPMNRIIDDKLRKVDWVLP
jgi:SAM-dependent methyltransferase